MTPLPALKDRLLTSGFAFVEAEQMREALLGAGPLGDWDAFSDSWEGLSLDTFMADAGRYRRRRHATFEAGPQGVVRCAHQPHYQDREYNRLNGGTARWFDPILEEIAAGQSLRTILAYCHGLFGGLAPEAMTWHVEVHQFRIEARAETPGQPTPEGVHRDGVDFVLVLLIHRRNIASGTTTIHAVPGAGLAAEDGALLGDFTLTHPFDAALVDDARVRHGVTAVEPLDGDKPAFRDVLVVTFRRK